MIAWCMFYKCVCVYMTNIVGKHGGRQKETRILSFESWGYEEGNKDTPHTHKHTTNRTGSSPLHRFDGALIPFLLS